MSENTDEDMPDAVLANGVDESKDIDTNGAGESKDIDTNGVALSEENHSDAVNVFHDAIDNSICAGGGDNQNRGSTSSDSCSLHVSGTVFRLTIKRK